jgi:hypothetical protein
MWESRVLCEISKSVWESFCDFRGDVISTARRRHDSSVTSSSFGFGRRPSSPAFRLSFNR